MILLSPPLPPRLHRFPPPRRHPFLLFLLLPRLLLVFPHLIPPFLPLLFIFCILERLFTLCCCPRFFTLACLCTVWFVALLLISFVCPSLFSSVSPRFCSSGARQGEGEGQRPLNVVAVCQSTSVCSREWSAAHLFFSILRHPLPCFLFSLLFSSLLFSFPFHCISFFFFFVCFLFMVFRPFLRSRKHV